MLQGYFTFRVSPTGRTFTTSLLSPELGDTTGAFCQAHQCAAESAAREKTSHWVLRSDTGATRYGFGSPTAPTLLRVMEQGYQSYWDFNTTSWKPLSEVEAPQEIDAIERTDKVQTLYYKPSGERTLG